MTLHYQPDQRGRRGRSEFRDEPEDDGQVRSISDHPRGMRMLGCSVVGVTVIVLLLIAGFVGVVMLPGFAGY